MAENPDTITTARLKQLCDLNVPYHGYVDDGYGTAMYIDEMRLDERTAEYEGVLYYSKSISIKSTKVLHTVKAGDNLWAIARKLNVTVDQIVLENNIRTPDLIRPGDVLNIKTDIKYTSQVHTTVEIPTIQRNGKVIYDISASTLSEWLGHVNNVVGSTALAMEKYSGTSTIGNNGKWYWEKPSGRAFYGNQYVNVTRMSTIGKKLGYIGTPVTVVLEVPEIVEGYMADGGRFGDNARRQTFGAAGAVAGGMAGAALGAKIGSIAGGAIGALCGGIGAVPGAAIGAFVGGFIGGWLVGDAVEKAAEGLHDHLFLNEQETKLIPAQ